jgi:tetratricopeptide (TPR) repeat protein
MTLNNFAVLYRAKGQNTQAETAYNEALEIYRNLSQTNPDVSLPDVAMTLNNLANLYSAKGQNTQAETAFDEALEIYRNLSQTNPDVYAHDLATTLVMGVVLFNKDKAVLKQAESLLEPISDLVKAKNLLEKIAQLRLDNE